jgi:F-type H+-transporting ATPase subunit delta
MSVASNRYAKALMETLYPAKAEAGLQQLRSFAALLKERPDGRRLLQNPALVGDRRKRLMTEVSKALSLDRNVSNFINILTDRNRLPLLDEIIVEYERLLDQRLGIVRARVTAARTLDAAQREALAASLAEVTGKQVRMEVDVDPSLIGGVIAQVGSTIYDGSVRQQLQAFKSRLVGE